MHPLDPLSTAPSAWAARWCWVITDAAPGALELITLGIALDEMEAGDENHSLLCKWMYLRAGFLAASVAKLNWMRGFQ